MSGIYIPGMEMPVGGCVNCIFCVYDRCLINLKLEKKASVTHGCPLVPVPDHGRLGDLDALKNIVFEALNDAITDGNSTPLGRALCAFIAKNIADEIEAAPTIIPADPDKEG